MQAPPLDRERAYDLLVEMMLVGEIKENEPLSERGLAIKLGLGRTPIREAIKDLAREGVLESHPTRGTVLSPLSVEDLQDLYEIRFAIEGLAAFLAASRGQIEGLLPYLEFFEKCVSSPEGCEVAQIHDRGVDFHYEIMRLAGNRRLLELYRPFRLRFRIPFGIIRHHEPQRVFAALTEHRDIARAIVNRDAERARDLMSGHLHNGLQFRMNMITRRTQFVGVLSNNKNSSRADAAEGENV